MQNISRKKLINDDIFFDYVYIKDKVNLITK